MYQTTTTAAANQTINYLIIIVKLRINYLNYIRKKILLKSTFDLKVHNV